MSEVILKSHPNPELFDSDRVAITGTQIGDKNGLDVAIVNTEIPVEVTNTSGIPVSMTLELTDKVSTLDLYMLNNLEDATPLYAGMSESTGKWLVKRFNESTGAMDYANLSNNPSITTYATAWTNRASLIYSKFHALTGV